MPPATKPDQRVLVVGAGPVGLTIASLLVQRGLRVLVVEARAEIEQEPRASTFHAPTLELLDHLDAAEPLIERGLVADKYQNRDRERGVVAEFDFGVLKDDTKYPFRLQCEQQRLCELLLGRLLREPLAEVRFSTRLTTFSDDGETVSATLVTDDGETTVEQVAMLIGADGASSTVRDRLGVGFPGATYEDRYLVYLTDYPFEEAFEDLVLVNYISDPEEFVVLLRAPEAWRVLFRAGPELTEQQAMDPDRTQERLHGVVARDEDYNVLHTQLYRIHQRVADQFRVGRVLLVGDAAHINSPIGGMGMNNGIHDAFDLARSLPDVLAGREPVDSLDDWAERRRAVALEYVQMITDRNSRTLAESDEQARLETQQMLRATASDPVRAREWLLSSSMISSVNDQDLLPYA